MLKGKMQLVEKGKPMEMGFFTVYKVIAESAEAALILASRFESESIRLTLSIEEANAGDTCEDELVGVVGTTGHALFPNP